MRSSPPASLGLFVGRTSEDARLVGLHSERLVTLRGSAGIGKTRMVREHLARHGVPHVFVDLAEASSEEAVATATWRALGVSDGAARGESDGALLEAVDGAVLVLDNFEHVLPSAARLVQAWLAAAPHLRVWVTSRAELGVAGEVVLELGPLSLRGADAEDAIGSQASALMLDRVHRARASFTLDDAAKPHWRAILDALEGVPLAIEIVAPRVARFGAEAVAKRLSQRLQWRGAGGSSLSEVLMTSWELLDDVERAALMGLSAFRGGFELDAAEHVVQSEAELLTVLDALVSKSLIHAQGGSGHEVGQRLHMLRSVREWVESRLEEAQLRELGARHAAFFAVASEQTARELRGPDAQAAWRWLARERENLAAAASCAHAARQDAARCLLALGHVAMTEGPLAPFAQAAEALLNGLAQSEPVAIELRVSLAQALQKLGQLDAAAALAEQALESAEARPALLGAACHARGCVELARGRLEEAVVLLGRGIELAQAHGDRVAEASCCASIGAAHAGLARVERARGYVERARAIYVDLGDLREEAMASAFLGNMCIDEGRLEEGELHLASASAIVDDLGDRFAEAFVTANLAMLHHRAGSLSRAVEEYSAAIDAFVRVGTRRYLGAFEGYRALARFELGEVEAAREGLRTASAHLSGANDARFESFFEAMRAVVELERLGCVESAARVDRASQRLEPTGDPLLGAAMHWARAHVALRAAQEAEARGDSSAAQRYRAEHERAKEAACLPSEDGRTPAQLSYEVFLAQRLCQAPERAAGAVADHSTELAVAEDGSWLRLAGERPISLQHRPSLMRLLAALIAARTRSPGQPVSRESLQAWGWPGERMRASAAANRVRVGIATLRRLGLREAIRTEPTGWVLDPDACLELRAVAPDHGTHSESA